MSGGPTLLQPGALALSDGTVPAGRPVDFITGWIRARRGVPGPAADRILVVRSRTGSGKSTVLPVMLLRMLRGGDRPGPHSGPSVLCTQPRVLTTLTLAADVSKGNSRAVRRGRYPDMLLGETVGYQTGPLTHKPPAGLVYATVGVLGAQLRGGEDSELMARYAVLVVDEAHERSAEADLVLAQLRAFYRRNAGDPRLPFLLLASATIEPGRYADYFGLPPANVLDVAGGVPIPRRVHWPSAGFDDYLAAAAEAVVRLHEEGSGLAGGPPDPPARADILVFVPGGAEIRQVLARLEAANARYDAAAAEGRPAPPPMLLLAVYREVVAEERPDYALMLAPPEALPPVGQPPRRAGRRVVVATNVAETGLTIDTLLHVVDGGWARSLEEYPQGAGGLVSRPAPRSRLEQRQGRVSRLFPGHYHPLYTENVYRALDRQQLPDIVTGGPAGIFLPLAAELCRGGGRLDCGALGLLDPPPAEHLQAALATAAALGLYDDRAAAVTPAGLAAAAMSRVPMEGARVLLAGYVWGAAVSDLATVVAAFGRRPGALWLPRDPETGTDPAVRGDLPRGSAPLWAAAPEWLRRGADPAAYYYSLRLLLLDDFLELLLTFDAWADRLAADGPLAADGWAAANGIDPAAARQFAADRETVLEEAAAAGIDPFGREGARLARAGPEEFLPRVRALKRCLFDGLRLRLLRGGGEPPDARGELTAATRQGLPVRCRAGFTRRQIRDSAGRLDGFERWAPRWLVTDHVGLEQARGASPADPRPLRWAPAAGLVSVLDGYVPVDVDSDGPRVFGGSGGPEGARGVPDRPDGLVRGGRPGAGPADTRPHLLSLCCSSQYCVEKLRASALGIPAEGLPASLFSRAGAAGAAGVQQQQCREEYAGVPLVVLDEGLEVLDGAGRAAGGEIVRAVRYPHGELWRAKVPEGQQASSPAIELFYDRVVDLRAARQLARAELVGEPDFAPQLRQRRTETGHTFEAVLKDPAAHGEELAKIKGSRPVTADDPLFAVPTARVITLDDMYRLANMSREGSGAVHMAELPWEAIVAATVRTTRYYRDPPARAVGAHVAKIASAARYSTLRLRKLLEGRTGAPVPAGAIRAPPGPPGLPGEPGAPSGGGAVVVLREGLVLVDGYGRLAEAIRGGQETVPAIEIDNAELEAARCSWDDPCEAFTVSSLTAYSVETLQALSGLLPADEVAVAKLAGFLQRRAWSGDDRPGPFSPADVAGEPSSFPEHASRIDSAELAWPLLVSEDLTCLYDGHHRLAKAVRDGLASVRVVRVGARELLAAFLSSGDREWRPESAANPAREVSADG